MPKIEKDAKIPCTDTATLQVEIDSFAAVLDLGEREDTWEKLERGLIRFAGVTRGGGYKLLPLYVEALGRGRGRIALGPQIAACMLSDRGRLSGTATDFLQTFAPRLAANFHALVPIYLPPLLQLLGRPNKVVLKRTEKCLSTIITNCRLSSILLEIKKGLYEEAATCRRGCATGIEVALAEWPLDEGIWNEKALRALEEGVKRMATDKDAEVRQIGRRVWARYQQLWPERVEEFSAPLTPTVRRYLEIAPAALPKPKPRVKNPARVPLPASRPLSVASSASSSSGVPAQPPRQVIIQPVRPVPTLHKARSMRQLPILPSAEQRLNSRAQESPSKRSPIKQRDATSHAQDVLRQSSKTRAEAPAPHALPRSFSTLTTSLATQKSTQVPLSKSPTRPQPSPAKSRPAPYTKAAMPKSASTLSLASRRHPPTAPQPVERTQDYRSLSASTSSAYADSIAAAIERRAYAPIPMTTSRAADKHSSEAPATEASNDRQHSSFVPLRHPSPEPVVQLSLPIQPSSTTPVEGPVHIRPPVDSLESPRPPSPFLGGTSSSVKNRIAMFEQRSRDDSKSPSPTPTISRVVSQSKPRSSSPLAQTVRAAVPPAEQVAIDVPLPDSPLVRIQGLQDTPRPLSAMQGDDAAGDTTFKVGLKGVSAEDLAELAEVFSAQASPEMEQGSINEPMATALQDDAARPEGVPVEEAPSPELVVVPMDSEAAISKFEELSEVVQTLTEGVDASPSLPAIPLVDTPTENPQVTPTVSATEVIVSRPASTESRPKDSTKPANVPDTKAHRAALPDRRPVAPRPPLGRVDRRPFKPTSHAQPTAASLARTVSSASKVSKDELAPSTSRPPVPKPTARVPSKPPGEARKVAFPSSASSVTLSLPEQKQPPLPSSASSVNLGPKRPLLPSSASVRSFSASTVASNLRSAPVPSDAGSTFGARSDVGRTTKPSIPPVARKIIAGTLPPIRKEKIKRKAPLPSFVPTRGNRPPLASSIKSTSASQGTSGVTAKVKTGVARVKPDTIPLPLSPADKPLFPHQIPLPHSPVVQELPTLSSASQLAPILRAKASTAQLTPLRKALSGTPIKAKVSPALIAESSTQLGAVGVDQRVVGSPIDLWRRSIPPSPVQVWEEAVPASPLAVRRGSVPPSPLAIQHPHVNHLREAGDGSPVSKDSIVAGDTLASPASPLRTSRSKSSTSPSPLAVHSVSAHAPISPTPANHHDGASSGDVQSLGSSSGEVESLAESNPAPHVDHEDLPSPFLRTTTEGMPQTKLRLSLESTPSRLRLPPTSPSPLAMATLARISAEQLVAISPTSSRSRHSLFRADLPLPANPDDLPSSSTRRTKASATSILPASDATEELLSEDEDELLGVQFNHPSRSGNLRPKVKNQLHVEHDLLEFSSSSRSTDWSKARSVSRTSLAPESRAADTDAIGVAVTPVHGQRTDVMYSPEKSVDILSKIVDGSPIKPKTPGSNRKALWERDSNAPESDE